MISYIEMKGAMRDAQIDAIKVYLYLKIACNNQPLQTLFKNGTFNTINLDDEELKTSARTFLQEHSAAAALYEYCKTISNTDKSSEKILNVIKNSPETIDYDRVFNDLFYGVTYSDYIFSLPMGAGKTFLMAAFIYLDLYFSSIDPNNKAFAQNFIVLAPSGLKTSIIPSLKTIRNFNPAWVLDDAVAESLHRELTFETLDADASAAKSNKAKNPNARKVALCLKAGNPRGIVFVTNAEKVILDRIDLNEILNEGSIKIKNNKNQKQQQLEKLNEDEAEKYANELRSLIGKIPRLSIFIDEVHHAADDSIKLRSVVTKWATNDTVVSVIGFSGTPYLQKPDKVSTVNNLSFSSVEINSVVFYYPLINGIGNFLKVPEVKEYEDREQYLEIVEGGLRDFYKDFKDKTYSDGTVAKVAIYCNSIDELEKQVYPETRKIVTECGDDPDKAILRYHEKKAGYKLTADASMEFATLDSPISKIRVVLLVQIGKEGWDCKSLTGVILAKENKSTRNMVLQTCCRCLRQVKKYDEEKARIYLCKTNGDFLSTQLKEEQHISIKEFQEGKKKEPSLFHFYNRTKVIELPSVDFYQFEINYTNVSEENLDIDGNLNLVPVEQYETEYTVKITDFTGKLHGKEEEDNEHGAADADIANFTQWLAEVAKGSFGFVKITELMQHKTILQKIFDALTYKVNDINYFSSKFNRKAINSKIRQSFYTKRSVNVKAEYLPTSTQLLNIERFVDEKNVADPDNYCPSQKEVVITEEEDLDGFDKREFMKRRYHYMPYHMDSNFEIEMLNNLMAMLRNTDLEVYYNGDRFLTDFHIKCYKQVGPRWRYLGRYTPDFLIVRRKNGEIFKAIIMETKGQIYAGDPIFQAKRSFIENSFIIENNQRADYKKFQYLYIQSDVPEHEQNKLINRTIKEFFEMS